MRKKCLVYAMAAVLLLANMPVTSYAAEAEDVAQTEQEERLEEEQIGEVLITADPVEMQESFDSVSGNDGQDQDDSMTVEEEQSSVTLPEEEVVLPSESVDVPEEDVAEIVQECEGVIPEDVAVSSVGDTGTYLPYEGAKYRLKYEVGNDGIVILGITGYESKNDLGELVIPAEIDGVTVTEIDMSAFYGCSGFTGDLNIPNSVKAIGWASFENCSGFTGSLCIPESVKTIGSSAFSGCSGFTGSLVIPNSVKGIWDSTFRGCSGFTGNLVIPDSLTVIDDYAFYGCNGFTGNLVISDSVVTIGNSAFRDCSGFDGKLEISNNVTTIGEYAFEGCSGFTGSLNIPNNVTEIAQGVFENCSGFNGSLAIPKSVTKIGMLAFSNCTGFTGGLNIPNSVTSIGYSAFGGCSGFAGSLTIPDSVTTIESYAFSGCSGFTGSLILPNSVTTIGEVAFSGCSGFTGSLTLPDSVTTIGWDAFYGCSGFTGSLTIPDSVTTIVSRTFSGCSGFTGSLTIPDSVTTIGSYAFSGCSGFTGSLTLPDSVTTIGEGAFSGCSGFTGSLIIPNSVTNLGGYAFENCSGFDGSLIISNNVQRIQGAFSGCSGFGGNLVIPNSVTEITGSAFQNCSGFTGSLVIPDSVIEIDYYAFSGCNGFTGDLIISDSVTEIGDYAFKDCNGFDGVLTIGKGVKIIGPGAFMGCNKFKGSLFVPNNVTEIGDYAFMGCSIIKDIKISASVEKIGKQAFDGGWGLLQKVTILGSETVINEDGLGESNFIWGYTGSTAENYAKENKCVFISLDAVTPEITEYRVSTEQELLEAIGVQGEGSYRHIILADGMYEVPNGISLVNLMSLTLEAEHPGRVEILSEAGNVPVILISKCMDIKIVGCILGHKSLVDNPLSCSLDGHVLYIQNSCDINVEYCDLYGCGITGIDGFVCGEINILNCVIRDCMRNIIGTYSSISNELNIDNCIISGNAYDEEWASTCTAFSCGGTTSLENCIFLNNYSTTFKRQDNCQVTLTNCSFYDNAWDNQTPKAYGICLNGITWQVDGDVLKIGYPLQLDADTVIQSKQGKVLDYSDSSLPWKKYKDLKVDVAAGVEYGQPQAVAPIITKTGDKLTIQAAMDGCTIYYTTDGTTPTAANGTKVNGSSVTLDTFSGTLKAIAVKPGYADSVVVSRNLTNSNKDRNVGFDVKGVIGGRNVTFGCATPGVKVYYSTTSSTITTKDKSVNAGETVLFENFYGTIYARSYSNGEWGNACRLILKIPVVNAPVISTDSKGNVTIRTSTPGSMIYYTTDGSTPTPTNGTRVNASSVMLPSFSGTLRAIAVRSCFTNSAMASRNLINSEKSRNVAFAVKGVFGGRDVTFNCDMQGAKVYYSSTTSKITTNDKCVNAGEMVRFEDFYGTVYARSYCNGEWGNVCRLILKIPVVSTPTISIDNQGYATIRTATPGCYLYYTTDGSTPSMTNGRRVTASQTRVYVGRGTTVKAIAVRSCFTNSQVAEKK